MKLLERYIHEVGHHLPKKNRQDIQAELRSLLVDTLEDRTTGEPTEADIIAVLEEFGAPKKVAASYFPEGQYLIGPTLFPVFRLVVVIAIASVIGAQLLSIGITVFFSNTALNLKEILTLTMSNFLIVLGLVVISFAILQWFDVKAEIKDEPWNPRDLPEISEFEPVKRGWRIAGIMGAAFILRIITLYPDQSGILNQPGGDLLFENPVIVHYFSLISLFLILCIALDIYLLWQGRWQNVSRMAKLALDIFSIIVLALLVQGHTAWLVERDAGGFFTSLEGLGAGTSGIQVIGMHIFRITFGMALIGKIIEVIVTGFRLIRANMARGSQPFSIPLKRTDKSDIGKSG